MQTMIKDTDKVYTLEYFKRMGRKGGKKTKKKYGTSHYSKINPKRKPIDKGVV